MVTMIKNQFFLGSFIVFTQQPWRENYLLDHELALREYVLRNDDINNLMSEDALTIPESKDTSRSEISTYIFSSKISIKITHEILYEKR